MDLSESEAYKNLIQQQEPEVEKDDLDIVPIKEEEVPPEVVEPIPTPDIKTRIYVDYPYLREFLTKDFDVNEPTMIDLIRDDENNVGYWFILFMDESVSGRNRLQEWLELSQIVKNDYCKLGYCNLTFEKGIFARFRELGKVENLNHPFAWAKFLEVPFMMVYRDHWPQGFYNGPMSQKSVVDFIMLKAGNGLIEIEKDHPRRRDFSGQIFQSEKKLEEVELREKAKEEDKKKQEELKEVDPRTQQVSRGVNFLEE
jgi:hypothetical protein